MDRYARMKRVVREDGRLVQSLIAIQSIGRSGAGADA